MQSIQGHNLAEKLMFSLFVPAVACWLPMNNWSKLYTYLLAASFLFALVLYLILSITPSKKILVAWDNNTVSIPNGNVYFNDIERVVISDCGKLSGWELSLISRNTKRKRRVNLSLSASHSQLTNELGSRFSNLETRRKLLGSSAEWIVGLETAILITGALRLVLTAIA